MRTMFSIGLLWAAYSVSFYGYCLIKSYNVSFLQLINPANLSVQQGKSKTGIGPVVGVWPPNFASENTVIPSGGLNSVSLNPGAPSGPNSGPPPG